MTDNPYARASAARRQRAQTAATLRLAQATERLSRAREAEREATPPSAGDGDEDCTCCWAGVHKPPAPAQEAAVEALDEWLVDNVGDDTDPSALAWHLLNLLDRGAVPGYGPTGASVGAGEVVVCQHDDRVYNYNDPTDWACVVCDYTPTRPDETRPA